MPKKIKVRKINKSLVMTIPKGFCEVVGIESGTKLELEIVKKDVILIKVVE